MPLASSLPRGGRRIDRSRYEAETAFEKMTMSTSHLTGQKSAIPDTLEAGKFRSAPEHQLERKNWSTVVSNKELYVIPGAVHTALYDDRAGVIPYDKMEEFFAQYLK